jgi:FKBP-type peptidyl-prolyl cis-trans isomerase SlyD
MKAGKGKYVEVSYKLEVGDEGEERELMEEAPPEKPMKFIYGSGLMLEAFEEELKGKEGGDKFSFSIGKEQAYGEYKNEYVTRIPKSSFHINGKFDAEVVKEEKIIPMYDGEGRRLEGIVVEVREEDVLMDFNHPLAGETLHFEGEIVTVREATVEELADLSGGGCGHEGCGGGCGGGCH